MSLFPSHIFSLFFTFLRSRFCCLLLTSQHFVFVVVSFYFCNIALLPMQIMVSYTAVGMVLSLRLLASCDCGADVFLVVCVGTVVFSRWAFYVSIEGIDDELDLV